ncbi:poly [Platysternon megacephalum]|uniref:Poly n=1 Tax=Platysternon megacephalum TaxID=55544 RepID=A0A4D9EEF7_9SAUR|nr:poly [Platysternon megacephalum]
MAKLQIGFKKQSQHFSFTKAGWFPQPSLLNRMLQPLTEIPKGAKKMLCGPKYRSVFDNTRYWLSSDLAQEYPSFVQPTGPLACSQQPMLPTETCLQWSSWVWPPLQ